jgi:hypothetical protein
MRPDTLTRHDLSLRRARFLYNKQHSTRVSFFFLPFSLLMTSRNMKDTGRGRSTRPSTKIYLSFVSIFVPRLPRFSVRLLFLPVVGHILYQRDGARRGRCTWTRGDGEGKPAQRRVGSGRTGVGTWFRGRGASNPVIGAYKTAQSECKQGCFGIKC